jgi:hypothetical protein
MHIDGDKVTITIGDKEYTFDKKGEASPTVGNVIHHRPIIIIDYIKIGGRKLDEPFIAVTDERKKSTKTLINRDTMSRLNLVVDPSKNNLVHEKLHLDKDFKSCREEEEVFSVIYDYFTKDLKLKNKHDFNIKMDSGEKGEIEFTVVFRLDLSDDITKECMNCGKDLCDKIEKETGFDYYWSRNYPNLLLKLSNQFV